MNRRRARPSLREQMTANQKALDLLAWASGRPRVELDIPAKRERRAPDPEDSEAPVLRAVGELLAVHPQVLFAVRQNSGAMTYERDGRPVPIWFYRVVRATADATLTDYWGLLRGGRMLAVECKRPSWKAVQSDREKKQLAFIRMVQSAGGVGGFVRSAEEAKGLLG